jgi:hypothetical protein
LSEVTCESWKNAIGHVIREEPRMWELDGLSNTITDRLIIGISNDETSCDDDKPFFSSTDANIEGTAPLLDSS